MTKTFVRINGMKVCEIHTYQWERSVNLHSIRSYRSTDQTTGKRVSQCSNLTNHIYSLNIRTNMRYNFRKRKNKTKMHFSSRFIGRYQIGVKYLIKIVERISMMCYLIHHAVISSNYKMKRRKRYQETRLKF